MFIMRQALKFLKKRNGTGWDWPSPNVSISSSLNWRSWKAFSGFLFSALGEFSFLCFFFFFGWVFFLVRLWIWNTIQNSTKRENKKKAQALDKYKAQSIVYFTKAQGPRPGLYSRLGPFAPIIFSLGRLDCLLIQKLVVSPIHWPRHL